MNQFSRILATAVCLAILISSCGKKPAVDLNASLAKYDRLMTTMNPDSISLMFAEDRMLGVEGSNSISGRETIRNYFASFQGAVTVLANESKGTSSEEFGDSIVQKGSYRQSVVMHTDTIDAYGNFRAVWVPGTKGEYLLKKMLTSPSSR